MAKSSSSYTDYNNLKQEIQNEQLQPVYLLHGEEYYFLDALLKLIEQEAVDEATKSFNYHVFYGKDSAIQDILNTCRRFPMMAERQVVIVKEAQHLRNTDGLEDYLNNPVPSTLLVWYHPGKKLAMNKKPGTLFKKHTSFYSAPITEKEIIPLVSSYIQHSGYDIEPKPLHLLAENSGFGFTTIVQELEKVFSNLESGNKIRLEHIEKYVGINKDFNLFSLQSTLASLDKAKAIEIARHFANNTAKFPLVLVLGVLFNFFKKVAIFQTLGKQTDKEKMTTLSIPYFALSEYRTAAVNYQAKGIAQAIEYLNEVDLKVKGIKENTGSDSELMMELVLKLLSAGRK